LRLGGAKVVALDIGLAIFAIVIGGVVEVRFRSSPGSVHMPGVQGPRACRFGKGKASGGHHGLRVEEGIGNQVSIKPITTTILPDASNNIFTLSTGPLASVYSRNSIHHTPDTVVLPPR
jgi:hypothetical protein